MAETSTQQHPYRGRIGLTYNAQPRPDLLKRGLSREQSHHFRRDALASVIWRDEIADLADGRGRMCAVMQRNWAAEDSGLRSPWCHAGCHG
jgi:hypothetical protein